MPRKAVHDLAGIAAGGMVAYVAAKDQDSTARMIEALGGCTAGLFASRLPDKFDPPTSPNHRGVAHGVIPVGLAHGIIWPFIAQTQAQLRAEAEKQRVAGGAADSDLMRLLHRIFEFLLRFAAGALAGAVGGYDSHLALDLTTPRGLPLIA